MSVDERVMRLERAVRRLWAGILVLTTASLWLAFRQAGAAGDGWDYREHQVARLTSISGGTKMQKQLVRIHRQTGRTEVLDSRRGWIDVGDER